MDPRFLTARLRILATSDLHAQLLPYDYYADRPLPAIGLAQAASLIRRLRAEVSGQACVLLDNGDSLTGGLLSDWQADRSGGLGARGRTSSPAHPMIVAMNALGYDAATLGNHDFDHGLPYLNRALEMAGFPVVSANILASDGTPLFAPSVLLPREVRGSDGQLHVVRIGIIGLAPPQTAAWNAHVLDAGAGTRDIIEAAREEIPRLREAGADIVVALCHSGIGPEAYEPLMENAAIPLAGVSGLDAIIAGHTHLTFPGPGWSTTSAIKPRRGALHGKPAVQPGCYGRHVGVMDLELERGTEGWHVAGHAVRVVRVAPDEKKDDRITASAASAHQALLAYARRQVGSSRVELQSYFSLIGPDSTLDVVADAKRAEASRLLKDQPEADLPILCAVAPFRAGGRAGACNYIDIPSGPLAMRQVASLYIHAGRLCLVAITGAGLREWLERSASQFHTLVRGIDDQPLLDPAFPSHDFDQIDGLTWTLDPSQPARTDSAGRVIAPAARRIHDLRHQGRSIEDGDRFVLATNSYRLGPGGSFKALANARMILRGTIGLREVLLSHVRSAPVDPAPRPRWRFASLPGTSAWFDTGRRALDHLDAVGDRTVEPVGPTIDGFHRFRLRL